MAFPVGLAERSATPQSCPKPAVAARSSAFCFWCSSPGPWRIFSYTTADKLVLMGVAQPSRFELRASFGHLTTISAVDMLHLGVQDAARPRKGPSPPD